MRSMLFCVCIVVASCACADIVGSSSDVTINLHGCCTDTLNRLRDGLEAYYPLHGDFNDHSGNGHDITSEDEVVWTNDVTGTMSALYATGDRHYAIPSLGNYTNNFSFAVWCRPETNLTSKSYVIFPVHGGDDDVSGVGIRCGTNGLEVVEHKGGYLKATLTYSAELGNRWHHVAVSVDANAVVKMYLDGECAGNAEANGYQKKLSSGACLAGGAYGDFLGGIGDVRYYTRALTDMDVAALCNISRTTTFDDENLTTHHAESTEPITYSPQWGGAGETVDVTCEKVSVTEQSATGLLHRWSFNDSLEDSVGGQTAIAIGDVTASDGQYMLSGTTNKLSYISLGSNILPTDTDGFTIEIWATQREVRDWSRLFDVGSTHGVDNMTFCWSHSENAKISKFDIATVVNTATQLQGLGLGCERHVSIVFSKVSDDDWQIVVAQRNNVTGGIIQSLLLRTTGTGWSPASQNQQNCWLGCEIPDEGKDPPNTCAAANYNEFRVWGRALTQNELSESARRGPDDLTRTVMIPIGESVKLVQGATEFGVVDWNPTQDGTYTLTHTVMTNGVAVGETLTATFVAEGFNPKTPVITPISGTTFDTASLSVSMACESEDATIHFTTNGATPTLESPVYKRFKIYGKTTVKAIAFYEDGTPSEMAVAEYARGTCEDPVITPVDGTTFLHKNQEVSITMGDEGTLRYTLDGSEPTTNSAVYAGPFTISESTVIKAKVFSDQYFDSQVVTANLTREWEQVVAPTNTLRVANSGLSVYVDLGCADDAAEVHYTLDGSDPTAVSPIYTKPFYAFDASTLKVVAVREDCANSTIVTNDIAIYCVVDLSGGTEASSYSVSYVVGVPSGGWTDEYKTTKLVLRKINVGSFIMGEDQTNESHRVTLTKPFYMGVFEVTQKQWELVTGTTPSYFCGNDKRPVEMVSYSMIRGSDQGAQYPSSTNVDEDSFIGKFRTRTGIQFDLPTEIQWEYACRASTTNIYSYGNESDGAYMWYYNNSDSYTHYVGECISNAWGLHDMHGNVWEWCLDWYDPGTSRVLRGGSFKSPASACTVFHCDNNKTAEEENNVGFRLAMAPQYPETPVILPATGTTFDTASLSVSMSCASEGATIHYTTDGTTPTLESPVYKRFKIYGKTTVKSIAFYEDGTPSEMAVAEYARGTCEDPVITPVDGTTFLHKDQEVSITMGDEGTLRYTLDGSEPTTNSAVYAGPFTISESTVIKAKVFSDSFFDSQVITANLTREWEQVAMPIITAASSFTGSKTKVSIACTTEGATIRYTTNGNDPNSHSTKYTGPFEVTASCTVKAYAVLDDYTNSEIASWSVKKIWGIGDALNMPDSKFTTSGDAGWVRDTEVSHDGVESMRSGPITHNQKSILSGSVTGAGTLTFWWKASCEQDPDGEFEWDHVEFVTDGITNKLDGVTDWQQVTCTFTSAGEHILTWTYIKDDVEGEGEDCAWVDELAWTPKAVDPIPDLGENPTDAQVATAISGSTDTRLSQYVTNGVEYVAYRAWATNVQLMAGGLAGTKAVHDSPHAWLSYALDSAVLVTNAPVQGEMRIASFEKNPTTGKFDFLVAVDGITVGAKAVPEKLATLFFVEGCSTVDGEYLSTNVSFEFETPSDGKVLISASPVDKDATQFFIKAKMNP